MAVVSLFQTQAGARLRPGSLAIQLTCEAIRAAQWAAVVLTGLCLWLIYPGWRPAGPDAEYWAAFLIAATMFVGVKSWLGGYEPSDMLSERGRSNMLVAWLSVWFVLLALAFAFKVGEVYSRAWAVSWLIVTPLALGLVRAGGRTLLERSVRSGRLAMATVIYGAGAEGLALGRRLREAGDPLIRLAGFVDDREAGPEIAGVAPLLGGTAELMRMIRNGEVDQVLIALPWSDWVRVRDLVDAMSVAPVRVLLAPDLPDDFRAPSFATIGNVPMLNLRERPLAFWGSVVKDIEDRVLGVLLMAALAPLFALIAFAIKLDSQGPVFFRQRRFGYNNEEIMVWKFRTMRTDMCDPTGAVQATKFDPRVTRVGAFLRRTSLDELPQILNVLQGNMSIVGPRPHAVSTRIGDKLMHHCVERYDARHNVKPGITGWAQIHGLRGEAASVDMIERRVEHDLYYIRNWSLALDLYIILRTALLVFKDDRAY